MTVNYKGLTYRIEQSSHPDKPNDMTDRFVLVAWHGDFTVKGSFYHERPDGTFHSRKVATSSDVLSWRDSHDIFPVYVHSHGNVVLRLNKQLEIVETGPDDDTDADDVLESFHGAVLIPKRHPLEQLAYCRSTEDDARDFVAEWQLYCDGEVYDIDVLDADGGHIESICCVYGSKEADAEAQARAASCLQHMRKAEALILYHDKTWDRKEVQVPVTTPLTDFKATLMNDTVDRVILELL